MVFHLAANSDIASSIKNPETDLNNTCLTTFNVLNIMRDFEIKKLLFASTSAIYGETSAKLTEDDVNENEETESQIDSKDTRKKRWAIIDSSSHKTL